MGVPYDVHEIETRWRHRWEADQVGLIPDLGSVAGDVFYNLVEFPYPSAEGLHVGHVFKYSGVDAFGRYQRMLGKQVFQPIGFDAFGIHTENFALKQDRHPKDLTARTTENFRAQLSRGGMAWDWRVAVDTSQPQYYRWTQWLLVQLFRAGLMYQAEAPVTWCPSCMTVLAREQTEDSGTTCERCASLVTERVLRQWFLRIIAYADRLVDGLDELDWPERAKRLQRQWIGRSEGGEYRLRDWLISRQRYWGPPIPIVHCEGCGPVAVPEEELPIVLPEVDDFRPTGTGRSPLAAEESFVRTACPDCQGPARRETDVSDTFVDSSWYFLRYPSADFADRPWDQERTARFLPVDFYAGGPEHVQRHHLYARFVTMALHDLGLVPFSEPFPRIRLGGIIVKDGSKMSKSRGNVVGPDDYVREHGSDVLRCALLFSAPWQQGGDFADHAIGGMERFFGRVWRLVVPPADGRVLPAAEAPVTGEADVDEAVDVAVQRATDAIEQLRFNVALSAVMELTTWLERRATTVVEEHRADVVRTIVLLLAPLAPHLAEELWSRLGEPFSVHVQQWPARRQAGVRRRDPEVVVQVDGRVRDRLTLPADTDAETTAASAAARPRVVEALGGREVVRVVHVPGRLVNLVTVRSGG